MKSFVMTITPDIAKKMLQKNAKNRPLNELHVQFIVREMRNGNFKTNGDPIRFFTNGNLADGQHRLTACVRSGVNFEAIVVEGVPPEAFDTIDTGRKRSNSDTFALQGEINCTLLASAIKIVDTITQAHQYINNQKYSNSLAIELLENHPGIRNSVNLVTKKKNLLLPGSIIAALHYLFSLRDLERATEFLESLATGVGLSGGHPILALRERLIKNQANAAKLSKMHLIALTIRAWNNFIKGTTIKYLRWDEHSEALPAIYPALPAKQESFQDE